jgi:hypothetical protein
MISDIRQRAAQSHNVNRMLVLLYITSMRYTETCRHNVEVWPLSLREWISQFNARQLPPVVHGPCLATSLGPPHRCFDCWCLQPHGLRLVSYDAQLP